MECIYTNGDYLRTTRTWHAEDSPWKAGQIKKILDRNRLAPRHVAEVGCGSGAILSELSRLPGFQGTRFEGYDISPQAIERASKSGDGTITFHCEDLLAEGRDDYFDLLLVIDVFEHVPDYMGFVTKCGRLAKHKLFHIPLDIHLSSVLRNSFVRNRYTIGHIHYFTADSALGTLKDTGHRVVDCAYTNGAFGLFKHHPSWKRAVANAPRWLLSKLSVPLTARALGGYSLLVLTE